MASGRFTTPRTFLHPARLLSIFLDHRGRRITNLFSPKPDSLSGNKIVILSGHVLRGLLANRHSGSSICRNRTSGFHPHRISDPAAVGRNTGLMFFPGLAVGQKDFRPGP